MEGLFEPMPDRLKIPAPRARVSRLVRGGRLGAAPYDFSEAGRERRG